MHKNEELNPIEFDGFGIRVYAIKGQRHLQKVGEKSLTEILYILLQPSFADSPDFFFERSARTWHIKGQSKIKWKRGLGAADGYQMQISETADFPRLPISEPSPKMRLPMPPARQSPKKA